MNSTKNDHPVWDIYDAQRTARLNVLYYDHTLNNLKRIHTASEIILAVSAASGTVGIWFFQTLFDGIPWKILISAAAIIAIAKPIIKISDRIQKESDVLCAWRDLDDELQKLSIKINQRGQYDDELKAIFLSIIEMKSEIVKDEPTDKIDDQLRESCYKRVLEELPLDSYFIPEEK
jgi:hypothetical protein